MNRRRIVLLGLGVLVLAVTFGIARLGDLGEHARTMLLFWGVAHAAYLAAVACVLRARGRSMLWIVLAVGLLARVALIPTAPTLSEDVYR